MYLPIGFQVDGHTEASSEHSFLLKLNNNLYGLKQGSYNWYEKLKKYLVDRGFKPSDIDPCLYIGNGMIILTYVDDCIIVGPSMENINRFVDSMKNGDKNFVLNDKGNINNSWDRNYLTRQQEIQNISAISNRPNNIFFQDQRQ